MTTYKRMSTLFTALAVVGGTAAGQDYAVTDLGVVSPYVTSAASAINNAGQVVGTLYDAAGTGTQAFLYSGGTLATLGTMTGTMAYNINDAGTAVGTMAVGFAQSHAFIHTTGYIDLGTFGGLNSYALGINSAGIACGGAVNGAGETHAFTWQSGVLYDIHTLAQATEYAIPVPTGAIVNSTYSEARDINDTNDAVGFFKAPNSGGTNTERAFHYRNEVLTELGNLGGPNSRALAINNSGRIVGWSELPSGAKRAAIFYTNGNVLNLGTTGATTTWSAAYAVNDSGVVVGASGTSTTDTVAFIYTNGANTDLNTRIPATSGWALQAATGINNAGKITGYGLIGGQTHAFLLSPSTGPSTGGGSATTGSLCGAGTGLPLAFACLCMLAVGLRKRW